jgi:hypothetical protein
MPDQSQRPDKSATPRPPRKDEDATQEQDQEQELDGTERARDEARDDGGPRYGGGPWELADERGDRRFGHARNDDADPSELDPADVDEAVDERPTAGDPDLAAAEAAAEIESGGQREGIGRTERPRKPKRRAK